MFSPAEPGTGSYNVAACSDQGVVARLLRNGLIDANLTFFFFFNRILSYFYVGSMFLMRRLHLSLEILHKLH